VSEVGFILDATLHLMNEQLKELKSAVNAGHLELKTEINAIKTDISAVTAGQKELKMDINGVKRT
jgi:hypothetical protein